MDAQRREDLLSRTPLGRDVIAAETAAFSGPPDEPRDDHGRWTAGGPTDPKSKGLGKMTTVDEAIKQVQGRLLKVRYAGHVWTAELPHAHAKEVLLRRDVRVKGHVKLGGATTNHWRTVSVRRPLTTQVEVVDD